MMHGGREVKNFSPDALKIWKKISPDIRTTIETSIWCEECQSTVTMLNVTGRLDDDKNLIISGQCEQCGAGLARLVETIQQGWNK